MRRRHIGVIGLATLAMLLAGLGSGSAAAAGNQKLVEGTVYDATCATGCVPECPPPPHCGPITAQSSADIVCAQRLIVCPLYDAPSSKASPEFCLQGDLAEGGYPVYSGEGAVVNVRKRGSATVLATLPVVEGHFKIRVGPGEYVLHPYLPEEGCLHAEPGRVQVSARTQGPIPASIEVTNSCIAHPDTAP